MVGTKLILWTSKASWVEFWAGRRGVEGAWKRVGHAIAACHGAGEVAGRDSRVCMGHAGRARRLLSACTALEHTLGNGGGREGHERRVGK